MVPKVAKKMRFGAIIIYNGAESGKKIEIRQWYNSIFFSKNSPLTSFCPMCRNPIQYGRDKSSLSY